MKESEEIIKQRYELVSGSLNERSRRHLAASEAFVQGRGGISAVSRATGLSRKVISDGIKELQDPNRPQDGRIRQKGGGRKTAISHDPTLQTDLEQLVEPVTRGDPESPLRWTCKSVRTLAQELRQRGHQVSHQSVSKLLHDMKYSLQGNRKTQEGSQHVDRDDQFKHMNQQATTFLVTGDPVISVDAKKKELVGNFKNAGRTWRPEGKPEEVNVYDFPSDAQGRVTPYGIYDLEHNTGWVNVGITHDTAEFAVESIRRWWNEMGRQQYPHAGRIMITADGGGSNGARVRLWKWELQRFADETGLTIAVCHFPPGTSKWNKIEHRLFAWISQNWRGTPLLTYAIIIQLISATKTATGLTVDARLDTNDYPVKRQITDEQMDSLALKRDDFHGEWNYTISPRCP